MNQIKVFFTFVLLTILALPVCSGQKYYSYAKGKQYVFRVTQDNLDRAPAWDGESENPPFSARKAVQAADEMLVTVVKNTKGWKLKAADLIPVSNRDKRWIWLVRYEWHPTKEHAGKLLPFIRIPVLMNGTAVRPDVYDAGDPYGFIRDFPEHNENSP